MRNFNIRVFDAPKQFARGESPQSWRATGTMPSAALFAGSGAPSEICRLYGYLMLLGQNLEFALRECLAAMQLAFAFRNITPRFTGNPERAKFEKLIDMFAAQLNVEHPPTKEFVDELHRARKLRNRLAHGFLSPGECSYYITHGGQQAVLHRLKLAEKVFFPVVMFINRLERGYVADYGITQDVIERHQKAWEEEQRQIDEDFKDILGDEDSE